MCIYTHLFLCSLPVRSLSYICISLCLIITSHSHALYSAKQGVYLAMKMLEGVCAFCMGDAALSCQSFLLLFLRLCRWILDVPQLEFRWHWRSSDLDTTFSAQVHWLWFISCYQTGTQCFLSNMLKIWFRDKHIMWVARKGLSLPVEPLLWDLFFSFPHRKGCCLLSSPATGKWEEGDHRDLAHYYAPADAGWACSFYMFPRLLQQPVLHQCGYSQLYHTNEGTPQPCSCKEGQYL